MTNGPSAAGVGGAQQGDDEGKEVSRKALKREAVEVDGLKQARLEERREFLDQLRGDFVIKSFVRELEQ